MNIARLKYYWSADLYRCSGGGRGVVAALKSYRVTPGFRFLFWLRLAKETAQERYPWKLVHIFARLTHKRLTFKYGLSIPWQTEIGPGFYIGHFGGVVVNSMAIIGKNCNIAHGVTIGQVNRGIKKGVPKIGDEVWIGAGAVVVGSISLSDRVMIAPNAVVVSDVTENAVVAGIPAKIVSYEGVDSYIEYTDY